MFSIGMFLFFFVGRFLLFALLLAGGLSLIYNIFRKASGIFYARDGDYYPSPAYRYMQRNHRTTWKSELKDEYPIRLDDYVNNERNIQVQ